jgi:hypothetical protein
VETPFKVGVTAGGYGVLRRRGCFAFAKQSFAQDDRGVELINKNSKGWDRGIPRFAKNAKHGAPLFVEWNARGGPSANVGEKGALGGVGFR